MKSAAKTGLVALGAALVACAVRTPVTPTSPQPPSAELPAIAAPALPPQTDDAPVAVAVAEPPPVPVVKPPTGCASGGASPKLCLVGAEYAKKLCSGTYPELTLAFFMKGTPWTRAYLKGDVDAWNASGGRTTSTRLAFDEEVIVLARHGAGGIVQTSASYDVLRWDGSCVSIAEGEMTTRRPPEPKSAAVAWRRLDEGARQALLESPKVKGSYAAHTKACASNDEGACESAKQALSRAITNHVRNGGVVVPSRLP